MVYIHSYQYIHIQLARTLNIQVPSSLLYHASLAGRYLLALVLLLLLLLPLILAHL